MDDYESNGRDYNENIDEGPQGAETEVSFFFNKPSPEASQKKTEKKSKTTTCECKPNKKSNRRRIRRKKLPNLVNPFLIFYLKMYFKNPKKPITVVAREAGKKWCSMSEEEKACYIKKAKKESAKRQRRKAKRMRGC